MRRTVATGIAAKWIIRYSKDMSFAEVLEELLGLTVAQRQVVIRRALELDDPSLSGPDEALVGMRLAAHRKDPGSSIPLEKIKKRRGNA